MYGCWSGHQHGDNHVNRLIHPAGFEPDMWREQLTTAAAAGGASLYASGIEPGFAADHLVLTLATQSSRSAVSMLPRSRFHCY